ncbi:MAG TPA: hypothetical protein VGD67_28255 [Pseudonocardiaceae bacterium]
MRSIRRALTLVAVTAAAGAFVLVGGTGAGASHPGLDRSPDQGRYSAVSGYQSDRAGQYDDVGTAIHTCYEYWIKSAHTTNYKWYHCHDTQYSNKKRVHICGNSGYLHGITITIYSSGNWDADNHAHDYDGEGCA